MSERNTTDPFHVTRVECLGRHMTHAGNSSLCTSVSFCVSMSSSSAGGGSAMRSFGHAQTETAAWSSNSICVVPAGYPKPAIPYEFEEWLRFQPERGYTTCCSALTYIYICIYSALAYTRHHPAGPLRGGFSNPGGGQPAAAPVRPAAVVPVGA